MKSAGFLSTLGVGVCFIAFIAFFLAPMYQPMFANRLTFLWGCLMASDILNFNWLFLPEEWRASETVKTFIDSFNTSFLPINRWSILLIVTIESVWIYSLGSLIFRALKNPLEESPLLRFCLTCLTGAAALSALTGFLGLIGCLQSWLFWTLAAGTIVTLLWRIRNAVLHKSPQISCELRVASCEKMECEIPFDFSGGLRTPARPTAYCLLPIALIALFCLLAVLPAMTSPWDFDVREYHLESVKEFWLSGRITALPNNAYANMPLGAESLILVSMALSGDWFLGALAGKTLLSLSVPLTALLLFALGEKYLSKRAGLIAAFIYVTAPLIVRNAQFGMIDDVLTMYALATAAVVNLEFGIQNSELREALLEDNAASKKRVVLPNSLAILAGIMAGMASAIKYPGALFVALPCFIVIFWKSSRLRLQLPVVTFLLTALLFGGVWYLKNAILLGNPVYPLCSSLFGSEFPVGFSAESYARWQTVHAPHGWTWSAICKPIVMFFYSSDVASPLFLPVLACCILLWKRLPNCARWPLIYSSLFLVGWHVTTHRIERFLLPIVPFIALAGGAVFDVILSNVSAWMGRILKGVLVLGAAYSLLILTYPFLGAFGTFEAISETRSSSIRLGEGLTQLVTLKSEELIKMKNAGERVLLIGDAAVFDWPVPVDYSVCFNSDDFIDSVTSKLQGDNPPRLIVVNFSEIARYQTTEYGYSSKVKAVLELLDNPDRFTPIYRSEMMTTTIYERKQ